MKVSKRFLCMAGILCVMLLLSSCRGWRSEKPPVHPNVNLDFQAHYSAQELARNYPEGITAWGTEKRFADKDSASQYTQEELNLLEGKTSTGAWLVEAPIQVTMETMDRGEKYYNIHCAVCHTRTGDGTKGPMSKRGWVVPNIAQDSTAALTDGELFNIATYGIRSMPGYHKSISVEDRWAIVVYIRALQKMFRGNYEDVPSTHKDQLRESR